MQDHMEAHAPNHERMEGAKPQATDIAAQQAITPQEHGDEFKVHVSPDAQMLVDELNQIENEVSALWARLYGPPGAWMTGKEYKGPPYLEKERINIAITKLDARATQIKRDLTTIAAQMGPMS